MPAIERSGPKLIYQQIIAWMRQQISSGFWPEHYRLPSEPELAAQLGVSRGTLRKAITQLISEGLLVSIHGRGTFVESTVIEQPLAEELIAFSEALLEKKIPFQTRVHRQELIQPPQRVASLLSISPGQPVLLLERVRTVGAQPVVYLINYIAVTDCPGIETVDFTQRRLFETLEGRYKLALGWGQRTFQAQSADEHVAAMLEINPCDPVMYMEQLLYLQNGSPIELSNIWLRGSTFRLSAIVQRGHRRGLVSNTMEFKTSSD